MTKVSFEKGVKGVKLNAIKRYMRIGTRLISSIILARLLPPKYFGIIGLALFFSNLLRRLNSFKFNEALLHKQENLQEASSTHFFMNLILGSLSLLVGIILFYSLLGTYRLITLTAMLILTLRVVVVSLGSTPVALLQKELKFKALAISGIISVLTSSIISILLAWMGYGIWSLVSYHILDYLIKYSFYWFFCSWKPKLQFSKDLAKYFLGFGSFLFIGSQFGFLFSNFNKFMIGTFINVSALAFYGKAYQFMSYSKSPSVPLIASAKPVFSESQDFPRKLSRAYNFSLAGITYLVWPLSITSFLVASPLIKLLIGNKWLPVAPIFRLFLPAALFIPLINISTQLLTMLGKPKETMKVKAVKAGVSIPFSIGFLYFLPQTLGGSSIFLSFTLVPSSLQGIKGATLGLGISIILSFLLFLHKYLPESVDVSFKKIFFPPVTAIFLALSIYYFIHVRLPLYVIPLRSIKPLFVELFYKSGTFIILYFLFLFLLERRKLLRRIKRIFRSL